MKFTLLAPLALALLSAPHFAFAQTTTTPGTNTSFTVPTPQQLLDHLFDPYGDGKTFTATFDVSLQDEKPQPSPALKLHLTVLRRAEAGGVAESVKIVGTIENEGNTGTFQMLDDGRDANFTYAEQAGHKDALELLPQLTTTLQTLVATYGKLSRFADFSPLSMNVKLKDNPMLTLDAKDKDGHTLRAVVDPRTRALLSLELPGAYSVRVSDQTFDAPIPDSEFGATQVADFRHANPHSMTLIVPSLLSDEEDEDTPTKVTAPVR